MSKFIFLLPKTVLREIVTSWLILPQIAKLDSALCVKECRQVFEQTVRFGHYCCDGFWQRSESFLSWVATRHVRLQSAVLDARLLANSQLRYSFLNATGNDLRSIEIVSDGQQNKDVDAAFLDVSMFCCQLRECTMSNNNDFAINAILARNPHLERVTLSGSPDLIGLFVTCYLIPLLLLSARLFRKVH